MSAITAVILTFNEQIHLQRCIDSILPLTNDIVVVDSFSIDETVEIAKRNSAKVMQRAWENNHATQFNWALGELPKDTQWIFRVDADEVLTPELVALLKEVVSNAPKSVVGIQCTRKMKFQGSLLKHGGMGGTRVLRMFRYGYGRSESRWMDEHIKVDGESINVDAALIDDNLNSLTWWIAKHNNYASREAVDLLNLQYQFSHSDSVAKQANVTRLSFKRKIKEGIYARLPGGLRAQLYFLYRYILLMGFLDDANGRSFHFLQAYWYRYLADAKVKEVERYMQSHQTDIRTAIERVLAIKV
jgi:glycosyltransferase involved in cell wall biosynthesis